VCVRVRPVPKAALRRGWQLRAAGERASGAVVAGTRLTRAEPVVAKRACARGEGRVRAGGAGPSRAMLSQARVGRAGLRQRAGTASCPS
jgi:hypothetical protein